MSESERDALDNVWNDLVTKLRERLASLEAEGSLQLPLVEEIFRNEFIATTQGPVNFLGGYISVWLDTDSGTGSWNQISPDNVCEPWSMAPDGIALLSDNQLIVDELATAFAAKLIPKPNKIAASQNVKTIDDPLI